MKKKTLEPEEIENLSRLLSSSDLQNISLGLEMLKYNLSHVKDVSAPLMLIIHGLYAYSDEEIVMIKAAKSLLKKKLTNEEFKELQQHFVAFESMKKDLKLKWSEFRVQLKQFEYQIDLYEPFILGNPDYQYAFYYDLSYYIIRRFRKYEKSYEYLKKLIDAGSEDLNIKSEFVDLVLNEFFIKELHFEEIPRVISCVHELIHAYPYYSANYYHILGIIYDLYALDKDKAKENYYKCLELDPNHDGSMNNLANIIYKLDGDYDEALRLVKEALKLNPKDYNTLDTLGCILFYGYKNYPEAIKAFEKVLKLRKRHHYSVTALGEVYEEMGDYVKAEDYYLQGLKIRPKSEYKLEKLKGLYSKMGK
jgi:tetratricopeptide (TPR) repeat protein